LQAFNPISESLVSATPYIFSGLSVAIALRCGIFNIGTEGQLFMGAIFSVVVGFGLKGLPFYIHMPLAVLAGAAGGALWALIPAILKTRFGSNEVINTIMLNYVAFGLNGWLLNGPIRRADESKPVSEYIQHSAELTTFFAYPNRLHLGIFIAIGVAILLYWFLFRTTFGLEIRTVGQNPNAARYSGMNITRSYIIAFCISGALGGLAGANEVLGVNHYLSGAISPGYGFDAISLSILGNNHPIGVILTSLLFGTLRNGGTRMQNIARVPAEIITVVQSLVVAFIAAPAIIKALFRIKSKSDDRLVLTRGWGK
ncbi:MAG: ABC transporter permease, partial [Chloroflexi bacterium]|nr:ABC transporter permease [Chloroflexota bacterium]